MLPSIHFTGNAREEKSSYGEQLYSLCGAGNPVSSEDPGTVVSVLALCPSRVPDPGTSLDVILAEDPAQPADGDSDFTSFSL